MLWGMLYFIFLNISVLTHVLKYREGVEGMYHNCQKKTGNKGVEFHNAIMSKKELKLDSSIELCGGAFQMMTSFEEKNTVKINVFV